MSGILRLANTGAGTGRSTLQSAASNDVTFNLPDTGADSTATILTSELHSITSVNWDGMTINITNADFNVDNGTLFVDESTNRVGIGTNAPAEKLTVADIAAASGFSATNLQLLRSNYGGQIGGYIDQGVSNGLVFSTVSAGTASEKVRILNNGNVGVGTTSPQGKLDIRTNAGIPCQLFLNERTTDNGLKLEQTATESRIQTTATQPIVIAGQSGNGTTSDIRFETRDTEHVRIAADGNVGIGTSSPSAKLEISRLGNAWTGAAPVGGTGLFLNNGNNADASPSYIQISSGKSSKAGIYFGDSDSSTIGRLLYGHEDNSLRFHTNDLERVRIDSAGRLLVGASSAPVEIESIRPQLVSSTQKSLNGDIAIYSYRDAGGSGRQTIAPRLFLARSRSGVNGSVGGIVSNNDDIGNIRFAADDGTQFLTAAEILVEVDGTPGTNDMPGRLVFSTTADGASSPTERMRIRSDGNVSLGDGGTIYQKFSLNGSFPTAGVDKTEVVSVRGNFRETVGNACVFYSRPNLSLSSSTENIQELKHFNANARDTFTQGTVTNQYGFLCDATLKAATNNFGFYSDIAAGSGRWNFYANGTAQNYFAGNTLFGSNDQDAIIAGTKAGAYFTSQGVLFKARTETTEKTQIAFINGNGQVGTIKTNGSATSYNTSSDYRLKENITPIVGAADRVKALKPCRFNFIVDATKTVDGFIAHEAQEVVPESVTGEKDGEEMQAIDTSKLVPLLTAALQEALAEIAELKERVKNLEG